MAEEEAAPPSAEEQLAARIIRDGLRAMGKPEIAENYKGNPFNQSEYISAHLSALPGALAKRGYLARNPDSFSIKLGGREITNSEINTVLDNPAIRQKFFGDPRVDINFEKNGDIMLYAPDGTPLTKPGEYGNAFQNLNMKGHLIFLAADAVATQKILNDNPDIKTALDALIPSPPAETPGDDTAEKKPETAHTPFIGEQIIKFRALFGPARNQAIAAALGEDISAEKDWNAPEETARLITKFNDLSFEEKHQLLVKQYNTDHPEIEPPKPGEDGNISEKDQTAYNAAVAARADKLKKFNDIEAPIMIHLLQLGQNSGQLNNFVEFSELQSLSQFLNTGIISPFISQVFNPGLNTPWSQNPPQQVFWLNALDTNGLTPDPDNEPVRRMISIKETLDKGDGTMNLNLITDAGNENLNKLITEMGYTGPQITGDDFHKISLALYTHQVLTDSGVGLAEKDGKTLIERIAGSFKSPKSLLTEAEQDAVKNNMRGIAAGTQQVALSLSLEDLKFMDGFISRTDDRPDNAKIDSYRANFIKMFGTVDSNETAFHFWNSKQYTDALGFPKEQKAQPIRDDHIAEIKSKMKELGLDPGPADDNLPEGTLAGRLTENQTIAYMAVLYGNDAGRQAQRNMETIKQTTTIPAMSWVGGSYQELLARRHQNTLEQRIANEIAAGPDLTAAPDPALKPGATGPSAVFRR